MSSVDFKGAPLLMYPTLIIGLGGTGTNVVRHVKRRLLRTWNTQGVRPTSDSELPSLLQTLVVDTEPLATGAREQTLYEHEYVFAGKFDATKLVYNKEHHPYLDWWLWDEEMIQPGYIHNGAKQLRPIGRLAFHRHFVTIRNALKTKLDKLGVTEQHHQAQERGFNTVDNYKLIYIVSSLCGGTGAGMFLDMAHLVRHMVGSSASIIGVFMMPSVFEQEVRADIQRRRIHANAYAALREIDHFHSTQSFKQLYQGQVTPIPQVPRRAFSQIFLMERTNQNGYSATNKSTVEQMAAHMMSLTVFSHMTKTILGFDVNVTEERSRTGINESATTRGAGVQQLGNDDDMQRKFLSYSSFGVSALVLPKNQLWDYFRQTVMLNAVHDYFSQTQMYKTSIVDNMWQQIKQTLAEIDVVPNPDEEQLEYAIDAHNSYQNGANLNDVVKGILDDSVGQILKDTGIVGYETFLEYMVSPQGIRDEIRPSNTEQQYIQPERGLGGQLAGLLSGLIRLGRSIDPAGATAARIQELQVSLENAQIQVRMNLADAIEAYVRQLREQLDRIRGDATNLYDLLLRGVETNRQRFSGIFGDSTDDSVKTLYEHETSAVGVSEIEDFIRIIINRVIDKTSDNLPMSIRENMTITLNDMLLSENTDNINQRLISQLEFYRDMVMAEFDIRYMSMIQDSDPRPPNHRTKQMFRRAAPAINIDGDIAEHSEMDLENTRLFTNPRGGDGEAQQSFDDEMHRYTSFGAVDTPYKDRIDVIHITHGLPVTQLVGLDELRNQYFHPDFDPRLLHLDPRWYFDTNNLTGVERQLIRQRGLARGADWAPSPWQPTTPAVPPAATPPPAPAPVPPAAAVGDGHANQSPTDTSDQRSGPYGEGV